MPLTPPLSPLKRGEGAHHHRGDYCGLIKLQIRLSRNSRRPVVARLRRAGQRATLPEFMLVTTTPTALFIGMTLSRSVRGAMMWASLPGVSVSSNAAVRSIGRPKVPSLAAAAAP